MRPQIEDALFVNYFRELTMNATYTKMKYIVAPSSDCYPIPPSYLFYVLNTVFLRLENARWELTR